MDGWAEGRGERGGEEKERKRKREKESRLVLAILR